MKKIAFTLTVVALGLFLVSQAFAWGPGSGRDRGCRGYQQAVLDQLDLTDAQKATIETHRTRVDQEIAPIREKMRDQRAALRTLWLKPNPDKDAILAAQKDIRALREQIEDRTTSLRLEIRQVLTPEQQQKLVDIGCKGPGHSPRGGMRGHRDMKPGRGVFP